MSVKDNSFRMYLEELKEIRAVGDRELAELLKVLSTAEDRGESVKAARNRLTEGMQHAVLELAQKKAAEDTALSDLIQEANMALLMVLAEYETKEHEKDTDDSDLASGFRKRVEERAEQQMTELLEAQKREETAHEELIARIHVLQKVSQFLASELNREPTVEELAEKMKMTEDEIREIMKETLAAMSVSPDAQAAEDDQAELEDFASLVQKHTEV